MYTVYAKVGLPRPSLQEVFSGTQYQCRKFIRDRVRRGLPTQFLIVSKLSHDAACRRYLP